MNKWFFQIARLNILYLKSEIPHRFIFLTSYKLVELLSVRAFHGEPYRIGVLGKVLDVHWSIVWYDSSRHSSEIESSTDYTGETSKAVYMNLCFRLIFILESQDGNRMRTLCWNILAPLLQRRKLGFSMVSDKALTTTQMLSGASCQFHNINVVVPRTCHWKTLWRLPQATLFIYRYLVRSQIF